MGSYIIMQFPFLMHYPSTTRDFRFLYGEQARFFGDEIHLDLKHSKMGTLAMASAGENLNASQVRFPQHTLFVIRFLFLDRTLSFNVSESLFIASSISPCVKISIIWMANIL